MSKFVFSSESVTEGHPDKVSDAISDAILDAALKDDPKSRVACETFVTTGMVLVGGEITTSTYLDIPGIARGVVRSIGYTDASMGFDADTCAVLVTLDQQSPDIAMGVDNAGAGDQGMMFGFACKETPELMPLPITLAHRLSAQLTKIRKDGTLPWLRPDGKTQVSITYENGKPVEVNTVVISTQHSPDVNNKEIHAGVLEHVINPIVPKDLLPNGGPQYHINPTGRFVIGGPHGDTGLTGRKIIVDTYGGYCSHGGGAFSGKDPSKVDRSAAYAARWVAKNVVAAGLADSCEIQLAYAIGVAEPVSILVNTRGTGKIDDAEISARISKHFDLTPQGIISALELLQPIYRPTSAYGHFGRDDANFPWEKTNRIDDLQS